MSRPHESKNKVLHIWSKEEKAYLKEITSGQHYKEIQELMDKEFGLNLTLSQIKGAIGRYKLNTGYTGQFKKGQAAHNKGKKGAGGWEPTQFKKGQVPANHRPVGSERVNVDGYVEIKVKEPNKWQLKHKVIWEHVNGPISKGYAVIFGDGDRSNLDLNNLILVSRQQLLVLNRNKLIQNDADLTRTGVIIADLYQKINLKKLSAK